MQHRSLLIRLLSVVCLCVVGCGSVSAQEKLKFSIADFGPDPLDLSAKSKEYEKYDGNGDRYAIIKVTSNNPKDDLTEYVFNFGNMRHIAEERNGVLWLYVQRNAKLVTITRNGYLPINKYDLHTTIESGKNYVMSLTSEDKKVYTEMVQFNIKPSTARAVVMVKSYKEGATEELFGQTDAAGSVAKSLEYGTYTYKVLADNYHLAEGRFTLNNRAETYYENVELRPNFSDMVFTVNSDADIYINGQFKGRRRWSGPLKAGNYQVECRQANHLPTSQYVEIAENEHRTITLQAPEPILGTVAITSTPLGADIKIDGKPYGQTPRNLDIVIGKHTVEVSKEGYSPESKSVEVVKDKTTNVNILLGKMTSVTIDASPSYTFLYVDGDFKGYVPYTYTGEVGKHQIMLERDGYKTLNKSVYFGDTKKMTFALKKQVVKPTDFYVEVGIGLGSAMNLTGAFGTHIKNFNIEAYYSYCITKSQDIYWNYVGGDTYDCSFKTTYSPSFIVGGKVGYGIIAGSRFKLTPQLGFRFVKLKENEVFSEPAQYFGERWFVDGAYCADLTVGLRIYCGITTHSGISITPEYAVGVSKSDGFKMLSDVSSKIKNMGEGFNARLSYVFTF